MYPEDFRSSSSGRVVRTTTGFWAFVPAPLPPSLHWSESLISRLSAADRALGELAGLGRTLPNPHLLIQPFMHREAVLSSRIEGTRASLGDLYAHEAAAQPALFDIPDDVQEVKNHVLALEYGLERLHTLPISLRLIREIHAHLLQGVRGERKLPGEFRRSQNWIGPSGSTPETAPYVPPPVAEMHVALYAFEKFLHASSDLPPLIRLGMVHPQFEAIHPFLDGNGRIGRLLLILLLCEWQLLPQPLLYLSVYFEARRQTYYDLLLAVTQRGVWEEWLEFFLKGVAEQAQDALLRIQRLQDLRETYRRQVQSKRTSARLLQCVDLLFSRPVITINQVAEALTGNYSMGKRYVERLEILGILQEISGQARNRVYRATDILNAIEEPLPPANHMEIKL